MELQANPDLEQLKLILWISGPMLFIMLTVIGYFLKQQIEASKAIADAVNALNIVVTELKTHSALEYPQTVTRLNAHSEKLDDHETRITIIETEHNHLHNLKRRKV